MSNSILTFSKVQFNPLNPDCESILIEDIAHALSLMTRANGHFHEFYSVAQHCIFCCEESLARGYSKRVAIACLLHDASEAYLADITRPVKKNLPNYLDIEEVLQSAIYNKFIGQPLSKEEMAQVHSIDNALLYSEFIHYMDEKLPMDAEELLSNPDFKFIPFSKIEKKYISLFNKLSC